MTLSDKEIVAKAFLKIDENDLAVVNSVLNVDESGNPQVSDKQTLYALIFDHRFAKAFFGEKLCCNKCGDDPKIHNIHLGRNNQLTCYLCYEDGEPGQVDKPVWQYHLQQMIVCENPVKYLEKFL